MYEFSRAKRRVGFGSENISQYIIRYTLNGEQFEITLSFHFYNIILIPIILIYEVMQPREEDE